MLSHVQLALFNGIDYDGVVLQCNTGFMLVVHAYRGIGLAELRQLPKYSYALRQADRMVYVGIYGLDKGQYSQRPRRTSRSQGDLHRAVFQGSNPPWTCDLQDSRVLVDHSTSTIRLYWLTKY